MSILWDNSECTASSLIYNFLENQANGSKGQENY